MFVRRKKSDDEENEMVVEPIACGDGNILIFSTLEISLKYTLYVNMLTFVSLVMF